MDNREAWSHYVGYTRDVTELARKLGFGAVAVAWVLKRPDGLLTDSLYYSIAFTVAFFAADVLQSLVSSVLLRSWLHREERQRYIETQSIEGDYTKPRWLDYPAFTLLLVKVILLLCAFAMIGHELWSRWQ